MCIGQSQATLFIYFLQALSNMDACFLNPVTENHVSFKKQVLKDVN